MGPSGMIVSLGMLRLQSLMTSAVVLAVVERCTTAVLRDLGGWGA